MAFKTYSALMDTINKNANIAIKNTCNRLLGKLQEYILSEYYDAYDTDYNRTMKFYEAAMTEMISDSCGKIFMGNQDYSYPFSGHGWAWTMAQNIELGNEGIHGGWSTSESKQHRYWDSFEEYCNKNAIKILKEELKRQGLNVK